MATDLERLQQEAERAAAAMRVYREADSYGGFMPVRTIEGNFGGGIASFGERYQGDGKWGYCPGPGKCRCGRGEHDDE